MKLTIITVCYNSEKFIETAIQSVLNQTYSDIEYILVDGGSKDNTINIIKKYEPLFNGRMKWISEKDNGIYDAMNKGIRLASGDVVGILNSDDFYINNNILNEVSDVFQNNDTDSLFANLYFVYPNYTSKVIRTWKNEPYRSGSFKKGWHPPHPTFFIKKICYDQYGLFDLSFDISADFELMLRFLEKNKIKTYFLDKFIVAMRYGGESTGSIKKIMRGNANVLKAFKKNGIQVSFLYPFYRIYPKVINFIKHRFK